MNHSLTTLTFEQDALNLRPFASRLEEFMLVERHFVEGALVISLGAPYGSGKSTFLRMWKADLDSRRKENPQLPIPIILNAWESDFCADPFLAVITSLIDAIEAESGAATKSTSELRVAAKKAAWFGIGLANGIVSNWSGMDPVAAASLAEERSRDTGEDIFSDYRGRVKSLQEIRSKLGAHFGDKNPGALILVDELDRCRPDYAMGYLETVKHIFGVQGLMFVLAVDSRRLAASAETVFGTLNFDEFYRKFVHRSVSLPDPDEKSRAQLTERYLKAFLEREGMRVCMAKIERHHLETLVAFAVGLKLTPRQLQEVVRIFGHLFAGEQKHKGQLYWCLTASTLLLAVIRVGDSATFAKLKDRTIDDTAFLAYLRRLLAPNEASWWATLYVTGSGKNYSDDAIANLFREAGITSSPTRIGGDMTAFWQGWGEGSGRFHEVVNRIDELKQFR